MAPERGIFFPLAFLLGKIGGYEQCPFIGFRLKIKNTYPPKLICIDRPIERIEEEEKNLKIIGLRPLRGPKCP